ncbi:MAG: hypothetical protein LBG73_09835 [Spirochaetaceae bacterium]|nr:hypothetical protein [Spirochaetaceae bacterium]
MFVGDKARLVIPLGTAFSNVEPVILAKPEELPPPGELVIHRIELERRASGGSPRLLIDFTAFAPGSLALPALAIPSGGSILHFSKGVTAQIASILTGDALVLGPPAPPVTVPGTSLLVYGTTGLLFFLILLGLGARFWGRTRLAGLLAGFRRRRLLRGMRKTLRNLRKDLAEPTAEGFKEAKALSDAWFGFRTFLTVFTGVYCHALAAGEFMGLSPLFGAEPESPVLSGDYLCGLFRRCDILRFSGVRMARHELLSVLDEMERFVDALNRRED